MTTWRLFAPAKINRFLRVGAPDSTGYHPVVTALQTLRWFDELEIRRLDAGGPCAWTLSCDDPALDVDRSTVARALEALAATGRLRGSWRIHLKKRIPAGSGLGGGSSDAAVLLLGLNRIAALGLSHGELVQIADGIGKDVPFFLYGGRALAGGYGERIRVLPDPPGEGVYLVLMPSRTSSTAQMYRVLDAARAEAPPLPDLDALARVGASFRELWRMAANDFAPLLSKTFPAYQELRDRAAAAGLFPSQWTGTGSAFWIQVKPGVKSVILEDLGAAAQALGLRVYRCLTLSRAAWTRLRARPCS